MSHKEAPITPRKGVASTASHAPETREAVARPSTFVGIPEHAPTSVSQISLDAYQPTDVQRDSQHVKQLLTILHKAYQAFSFYPFNHPVVKQFSDHLYQALDQFFQQAPYLELRLDRFQILFYDEVVFEEQNVNNNFVYLLYSDGIRKLIFYSGLSLEECFRFFAILHQCSGARSLYEDVVTLMWEESFAHIRYFLIEDLNTMFLPSFAAIDDDESNQNEHGPTVRISKTSAPPSDSNLALRTAQQLAKTRLALTDDEQQSLEQLLVEEEFELMHRFLELLTLIIQNHRESPDLQQLIKVLQQLQPIIVSVGGVEDMLLCFRYIGHLTNILQSRGSLVAKQWSAALQTVLPEAYKQPALQRLIDALTETPNDRHVHQIVSQYILFIQPPTPDLLLQAMEQLEHESSFYVWTKTLAHKYQQHPRKLMPGVLSPHTRVIQGTCRVLGMIRKEDAWPLLERAANHNDNEVRIEALKAMMLLEDSDTTNIKLLGWLETFLADTDISIRKIAIGQLFEMGPNALFLLEKLFGYKTFENWEEEEVGHLFHQVARLCSYYNEAGDMLANLLLQQYNGRFQSKQKQKLARTALQALKREHTPQTAVVVERIYEQATKPLKRICEELFPN
jgi:hypothetical protein